MISLLLCSVIALKQQELPLELPDEFFVTPMCPQPLNDSGWIVLEQYYVRPNVLYSKYFSQKLGERRIINDEVVVKETPNPLTGGTYKWNPIVYRGIVDYEVTIERWEDRNDWGVINVEWRVTVKNYRSNPYTGTNFRFFLPTQYCPYPATQVQGNIYWDWTDAPEWYADNSTPEEYFLYASNGAFVNLDDKWEQNEEIASFPYLNIDRRGRESIKYKNVIIGRGGDMYFGCRRVMGPMYDPESGHWIGDRNMPRDIEWNDRLWKWRYPVEEDAIWNLGPIPENDDDPGKFGLAMQFKLGGAYPIRYNEQDEKIPPLEVEWLPNVVVFHSHVELKMLDIAFPEEGCPVPALDQEPDYSSDEVIMIVD